MYFLLSCCSIPERGYTRSSEYLWCSRRHFRGTKRLRPADSSIALATRGQQARAQSLKVSLSSPGQINGAERTWVPAGLVAHAAGAGSLRGSGTDYITLQLPFLIALLLLSAHFIWSKHFASKGWKIQLFIIRKGKSFPQLMYVHLLCGERLNGNEKYRAGVQHFIASLGRCLSSVLTVFQNSLFLRPQYE